MSRPISQFAGKSVPMATVSETSVASETESAAAVTSIVASVAFSAKVAVCETVSAPSVPGLFVSSTVCMTFTEKPPGGASTVETSLTWISEPLPPSTIMDSSVSKPTTPLSPEVSVMVTWNSLNGSRPTASDCVPCGPKPQPGGRADSSKEIITVSSTSLTLSDRAMIRTVGLRLVLFNLTWLLVTFVPGRIRSSPEGTMDTGIVKPPAGKLWGLERVKFTWPPSMTESPSLLKRTKLLMSTVSLAAIVTVVVVLAVNDQPVGSLGVIPVPGSSVVTEESVKV